jgi:hypothetical protein
VDVPNQIIFWLEFVRKIQVSEIENENENEKDAL